MGVSLPSNHMHKAADKCLQKSIHPDTLSSILHRREQLTAVRVRAAAAPRIRLTNRAALSIGDHHLLAVGQLIALDLLAEHLTVVTHAEPAWLWLPDVLVAVHLAVRRAAPGISWDAQVTDSVSLSAKGPLGFVQKHIQVSYIVQLVSNYKSFL